MVLISTLFLTNKAQTDFALNWALILNHTLHSKEYCDNEPVIHIKSIENFYYYS